VAAPYATRAEALDGEEGRWMLEYPFRVWGLPYVITFSPLCNGPGPTNSVY
jgi:hypothetical protein